VPGPTGSAKRKRSQKVQVCAKASSCTEPGAKPGPRATKTRSSHLIEPHGNRVSALEIESSDETVVVETDSDSASVFVRPTLTKIPKSVSPDHAKIVEMEVPELGASGEDTAPGTTLVDIMRKELAQRLASKDPELMALLMRNGYKPTDGAVSSSGTANTSVSMIEGHPPGTAAEESRPHGGGVTARPFRINVELLRRSARTKKTSTRLAEI
jgi:hypothetical protein